jgi:hypothetical protein
MVKEDLRKSDPERYTYEYVLKGKYKHYCWEWDGMTIDETCPEFLSCSCYDIPQSEWDRIQTNLRKYLMTETQN